MSVLTPQREMALPLQRVDLVLAGRPASRAGDCKGEGSVPAIANGVLYGPTRVCDGRVIRR